MIRGTNAKFRFDLPCNFSDLKSANIVFWQDGNNGPSAERPLPIKKVLEQCEQGDETKQLVVILSQEETLRFTETRKAYAQLMATDKNDTPIICHKKMITVDPIYDESILGEILPTPDYDDWVYLDGGIVE